MRSIADELRRDEARRRGAAGTAEDRLLEALRLGDSGVALRIASTGEAAAVARSGLERQAAHGRRPSRCAER
jgi:hypothetical protein